MRDWILLLIMFYSLDANWPSSMVCLGEEGAVLLNNSYGLFLSQRSICLLYWVNTCSLSAFTQWLIMCLCASTVDLWLLTVNPSERHVVAQHPKIILHYKMYGMHFIDGFHTFTVG